MSYDNLIGQTTQAQAGSMFGPIDHKIAAPGLTGGQIGGAVNSLTPDALLNTLKQGNMQIYEMVNLLRNRIEPILGPQCPRQQPKDLPALATSPINTILIDLCLNQQNIMDEIRIILDRVVL